MVHLLSEGIFLASHHVDSHQSKQPVPEGLTSLQTGLDASTEKNYRRGAALIGLAICVLGVTVGATCLRFGWGYLGANTAFGFFLAGLILSIQSAQSRNAAIVRVVTGLLAFVIVLLGMAESAYLLFYRPTWLTQVLAFLPLALTGKTGESLHPLCATSFMLVGFALLLQDCRLRRGTAPSEYIALFLIALNLIPLAGHAYGVKVMTSFDHIGSVPWAVALAFLALGCGVLLARPRRRLMSIITENVPGGQMLRRSLPLTLMVLVLLNWMVNRGAQDGYYPPEMASPLLTLMNSAVILVIFWRTAFTVNNEYRNRLQNAADLAEATSLLIAVSDHTDDAIFVKDRAGRLIFANPAMLRRLGKTRDAALYRTSRELLSDPDEADRIQQDDQRIMQTGRAEVIEQTLHYEDGLHTFIATKTPWYDSAGTLRGITGISTDISARKAIEQGLLEREAELESTIAQRTATLRKLADHLESVREEEKRAIARELHDDMGASLTSLNMYLDSVYKALPEQPEWQDKAQKIRNLIASLVATTRRIQIELRPIMLDLFGLKAGIIEQTEEFEKRTSIVCKTSLPDEDVTLDHKLEITIYRMLQEALNNVAKHAQAKYVDVILDVEDDRVALTVRDDGIGIADERLHNQSTYGLRGLSERAAFLGGTAKIMAASGKGTTVTITLPTAL